ncbi:MAG: porin family protein [Proteobacteria bacterium]|nr:porin family protein [Pseudomonadota bacterium]
MKNLKTCAYFLFTLLLTACLAMSIPVAAHAEIYDESGETHEVYDPYETSQQGFSTTGLELRLGLGYLGGIASDSVDNGAIFNIDLGYRWDWVGFTVDLGLGGVWLDRLTFSSKDRSDAKWPCFIGTLHVNALFTYNLDRLEIWGKLGGGFGLALIFPTLTIKAAVGVSYRFTETFGMGADFAYMPMLSIFGNVYHLIATTGHLRFHF